MLSTNGRAGLIKNFSRIKYVAGVKGVYERAHHIQAGLPGKTLQIPFLGQADTVFAGDGASKGDSFFKNLTKGGVDAFDFFRIALVAKECRMQIAVAEVTEDADAQLAFLQRSVG
jgi:hypothetical protein